MNAEETWLECWQQQTAPEPDPSTEAIRRRAQTFQRGLGRRDFGEYVAVALIAGFLVWLLSQAATAIQALGAVLALLSVGFVGGFLWWKRRRVAREAAAVREGTLPEQLRASRAEIVRDIWLLRNVLWWYLLPCGLGVLGIVIATGETLASFDLRLAIYLVGVVIFFAVVHALNQSAVRRQHQPHLEEIEGILASLEAGDV